LTGPLVARPPVRIAGAPGGPTAGATLAAEDLFDVAVHTAGDTRGEASACDAERTVLAAGGRLAIRRPLGVTETR